MGFNACISSVNNFTSPRKNPILHPCIKQIIWKINTRASNYQFFLFSHKNSLSKKIYWINQYVPASLSQTCEPKEDTRYERHCYSLIWPSSKEKKIILFKFGVENLKKRYLRKKQKKLIDLKMRVVWKLLRHLILVP